MNPRIHKVGSSFKGLASYLLQDKESASTERVGWVETVNMGTSNPETAWRVMAATAMKQAELKREAGIKSTGQKAKGTVLHYSLSWSAEEAKDLTKEEMIRAAKGSLAAYGVDPALFKPGAKNIPRRRQFADEHQAMIVCHTDEKHPHVHVVVNRVHPKHGSILPNGKEREKLSKWALEYEKSRGEVLCKQRERNWNMRDRGIWVKGEGHEPRHVWEMRQDMLKEAANDNPSPALQKINQQQASLNAALGTKGGEQAKRHRQEWIALDKAQEQRKDQIKDKYLQTVKQAKARSAEEYKAKFTELQTQQAKQTEKFKANEAALRSKAGNVWESVKLLAVIRGEEPKDFRMKDIFSPFAGAGARLELLQKSQLQKRRALEKEQDLKLRSQIQEAKNDRADALKDSAQTYTRDKKDLVFVHDMENAALKSEWKKRNDDQRAVFADYADNLERSAKLKNDYLDAVMDRLDEFDRDSGHSDAHDDDHSM